jgi:hypothetical protein
MGRVASRGKEGNAMGMARGYVLGLALVFGLTLGAPVALSGADAPVAIAALNFFVEDVAAQEETITGNCNIAALMCIAAEGGDGGPADDATSSSGDGARGGNGNGGLAILHNRITTSSTSETSLSLSDVRTGDINHELTIIVEDTDETVVINTAGSPGSTGVQMMNIGGAAQSVNTGGNTSSADASGSGGDGGDGGDSGDATSSSNGGATSLSDVSQLLTGLP